MAGKLHRVKINTLGAARLVERLYDHGFITAQGGASAWVTFPKLTARYRNTLSRSVGYAKTIVPNRVALIDDEGSLSYRELQEQSYRFAQYLHATQKRPIRLGVVARNSRNIVIPMVAKGYVGCSIYLLNVHSSPKQLADTIKENHINALVIDDEFIPNLSEVVKLSLIHI